ncbi:TetR/AcrR family transcriptional regulator [Pseudonocardia acidicola]|uniref:TetR/AcrR family transcriptional regulator n=1 Tax=Pseudonocardia acidicola TaxID=2724939 RepID=A0ABX1SIX5_9PSEU|nr:TetR/AcrR family transcriptional regulator [Pseudonocardia acidicola]NMI01496.1 TetR/AcrR family transcriptional regulator [Pseudonocardia acidicola]
MPPDERRAAIVDATLPLVLQHGAGVSTRQIAEAAHVAEGTIFRVFPDKDALMHAVTEKAFDPGPALRELSEVDRDQSLRDRLVAATRILQRRLSGVFGLLDALGLNRPPGGARCRAQAPSTMNDAFRAAIVDLIGPDEHRLRVSAAELAHVLRLLVVSGTHPRITDGRPLAAEEIVAVLLDGLRRPGTPAAPSALRPTGRESVTMIED